MGRHIGIDFGASRCVVAVVEGGEPRVLLSRENRLETCSVVSLKRRRKGKRTDDVGEGEILVGDVALDNWAMAPRDTILGIRRLLGRDFADPDVRRMRQAYLYEIVQAADAGDGGLCVLMGGKTYTPVEIAAMILRRLKEDAEFRLGEEVTHAVITAPAHFTLRQREAMREAGLRAGLAVMKVLDEPTAAAVRSGMADPGEPDPTYAIVLTVGASEFDVCVQMHAGGVVVPLSLQGDLWLGTDDFEQAVADYVVANVRSTYDIDPRADLRFMFALKKAVREALLRLAGQPVADLVVPGVLHDSGGEFIDVDLELTRDECLRLVRPAASRMLALSVQALETAGLKARDIDRAILTGDHPELAHLSLEAVFNAAGIATEVALGYAVALGAALIATRIGGIVCQALDAADPKRECGHVNAAKATVCAKCGAALPVPQDLGEIIEIGGAAPYHYGFQTPGGGFDIVIEKEEAYPNREPPARIFHTLRPGQRTLRVPIYGGDNVKSAGANEKQGDMFMVLPPDLPPGTAAHVRLWLDGDGVFGVSARLADGTDLEPIILAGEKDQKAVEALESAEAAFARKAPALTAAEMALLDAARQRAYEALQERRYDDALREAEALARLVARMGGGPPA
jgi:molecular chaperone DnaK (HSP70)